MGHLVSKKAQTVPHTLGIQRPHARESCLCKEATLSGAEVWHKPIPWKAKVAVVESLPNKDPESWLFIHFREQASCNWSFLSSPKLVLVSPHKQREHI